ncbi:response regulator transcription factor [Shouchella miscanthi]|uniref:response regulator transcription factor n=1 Tax=Shouchella miscanthi TaxID=2598861 RepID=UPI0011A05516|nr:response regulator transcription factor [Shouchella miscanthi]
MTILIVDDDSNIQRLVSIHLKAHRYHVCCANNAEEALSVINNPNMLIQLAIVDVMMPGMDGYTLTKTLTEQYDIPVILLTAKGNLEDKEKGFLSGSDDYIVKPFEVKELIFRVAVVLKRNKSFIRKATAGNVHINRDTYELTINDHVHMIPLKEFELLSLLIERSQKPVGRDFLIEEVWDYDQGTEQSLNTHINRIRERLKQAGATVSIKTLRGIGYKLEVNDP